VPLVDDYKTTDAVFEKYKCGDGVPNGVAARKSINSQVATRFDSYLQSRLLEPFGIKAGYRSSGSNWAYGYDFSKPTAKGQAPNEKALLGGGSGGMKWSADAYARFLAALDQGKIVRLATVRQMKAGKLGFNGSIAGAAGSYPTKDGGSGNFESRAMMYPGRMSLFVTINSSDNDLPASLRSIMINAFDDALK
jgi:CubicO group peptidase (beta-lactamase class C family)